MASTYLTRTMSGGSATTTKFTFSAWVKRTGLNASDGSHILSVSNEYIYLGFANDTMRMELHDADNVRLRSTRVFRDTNAWYHVVFMFDSTQATASDRMKMWVNNEQITSFSVENYPSQNYGRYIGGNTQHTLGRRENDDSDYFDGILAHAHLCVGYAYSPSDFGETDSTTGIWKPKTSPSVTYGNNGFFLKFENSGAMGTDSSGNSNTFTVNGTMTQLIDTPSNVFATINPLAPASISDIQKGNLQITQNGQACAISTLGFQGGKYYWECRNVAQVSGTQLVGVIKESRASTGLTGYDIGTNDGGWGYFMQSNQDNGKPYHNGTLGSVLTTTSQDDILMIAVDGTAGKIWWGVNGTWVNSGNPANGTNAVYTNLPTDEILFPAFNCRNSGRYHINFGNGYFGTTAVSSAQNPDDGIGIFEYDVPAGYKALCTKSINAQEYS